MRALIKEYILILDRPDERMKSQFSRHITPIDLAYDTWWENLLQIIEERAKLSRNN